MKKKKGEDYVEWVQTLYFAGRAGIHINPFVIVRRRRAKLFKYFADRIACCRNLDKF